MILILVYLLMPALVIRLCDRYKFLEKIGPILLLYIIGAIIGNTGLMPASAAGIQDIMTTLIIPLAIPMMLFSCNFRHWDIKRTLTTLITGIIAVIIAVVAGYYIFKPIVLPGSMIESQFHNIAGLMAGVYTGGTPNMAAIKIMLEVPNETYLMVHSYDMLISFAYMVFLLSIGIRLFRRFLKKSVAQSTTGESHMPVEQFEEHPYRDIFKKRNFLPLLLAFGLSLLIFGVSAAISMLFSKDSQVVVIIMGITTLGIAASFVNPVRRIKKSFDAGMYLVYIFSIVVASMADVSKLDLAGGISVFLYILTAIFGSLLLHLLMARLFKLDPDTVIIASVALVNSPPFVPMMATAMKNKNIIISGLTIGLAGYAIGNYLGFIIANVLKPIL